MNVWAVIYVIASFLLGSVPFGLVLARLTSGVDLRASGSGNIGATNVARTLGMKKGLVTLFLDMGKGLLPVLAAGWLFGGAESFALWLGAAAGLAAFLGHIYSPFLGFKGGKGVATALGVFLGAAPLAVIPAILVFAAIVGATRYVSAGSMASSLVVPPAALLMGYPGVYAGMALVVTVFVFIRHRANIGRLMRGEENRFGKK